MSVETSLAPFFKTSNTILILNFVWLWARWLQVPGSLGSCVRVASLVNPRRACAARVTVLSLSVCVCVCVSESVTSLTATPLTHRYKVSYNSNANALLKVFDSWISLKILCSKVTALFAHLNEL